MTITPIGWFLIPLGIILFVVRPKWLYVLTIFFAPFSATSIINAGGGDSASGFTPYLFFGFLLLLRECAGIAFHMKVRVSHAVASPLRLLYLFGSVCLVSLVMPFVINGRIDVMSNPTYTYKLIPLEYNRLILNHAIRLIFNIILTAVIVYRNLDVQSFFASLRVYLGSGVFICLWGLMQFSLYIIGISYPAYIFNNSVSPGASGYSAVIESAGFLRVSSVATESSFLSRVLVGMLAISIVATLGKTHIFHRYTEYIVIVLLFVTILLTGSSTGYVGIVILLLMLLFIPFFSKRDRRVSRLLVFVVIFAVVISYFTMPVITNVLDSQVLNKNASGSAMERAIAINYNLQYFLSYPILGIGWDCAPTKDLIIGMLGTCGLAGLSAFFLLIGTILYKLKHNFFMPIRQNADDNPSIMMFICLLVTCAVYAISGEIEPPDFWVILGLSIAAVGIGHNLRHTIQGT